MDWAKLKDLNKQEDGRINGGESFWNKMKSL